ncbi:MAG: demethoxyubiquinone hydroxylase family protein [Alphaproteobacteria bacterium]|nr:demethoxyubiquinone hydroxylase family protein [Alphaproteobacteria bacterium]
MSAAGTPETLPGDLPFDAQLERMIRVNHAGEYGAKRIYAGQLAVLGKSPSGDMLRHMAAQEEEHLKGFSEVMIARKVRPTVLSPLWHVAGYAMGAATALMGEKAAMACTVAVESVIDEHYAAQEAHLGSAEPELKAMISRFRAEEKEHHDTALEHGAEESPFYGAVTTVIKLQTKFAIWLSSRI